VGRPAGPEPRGRRRIGARSAFGIPAAITAAILKHQLYDIDRIIGRTLSYAIVTGLLVAVYAGLVLLATQVLSFSSPVAVAISALAAAALFSPLRNRVQQAADRKFNRARYDTDRTVTAFAARLQGEVDIGAVRTDLLSTVNQTLEPDQLSLWLTSGPDDGIRAGHQPIARFAANRERPGSTHETCPRSRPCPLPTKRWSSTRSSAASSRSWPRLSRTPRTRRNPRSASLEW
jgi:hypothetical protein